MKFFSGFVSPLGRFCEDCSPRGGVQGGCGGGLSEHRHHGGEVGVGSQGCWPGGVPATEFWAASCLSFGHSVLILSTAGTVICSGLLWEGETVTKMPGGWGWGLGTADAGILLLGYGPFSILGRWWLKHCHPDAGSAG